MQFDNSFHPKSKTGEAATNSTESPFHAPLQSLTYNPEEGTPSIIEVRNEANRIKAKQTQGAASGLFVEDPPINFTSRDAVVTRNENGTPVLKPYEGQGRIGDYPGGKGTADQVDQTKKLIMRALPVEGELLFALFDKNYNTRVGENYVPGQLTLDDAPKYGPDARYQLHFDVDLYAKENHGPTMPARDMRPHTDDAPGDGKRPDEAYAVIADKNNTPLDVLTYDQGTRYKQQFKFTYVNNPDGTSMVAVQHYEAPWLAKTNGVEGKITNINGRPNVYAGLAKYYYDANHHCVQAEQYTDADLLNKGDALKPSVVMKFDGGRVSGTEEERGTAKKYDFFDLLGPRLPDRPVN